ncbi:MAG TPA: translation initiation factor IF-2 [Bacteroidales bacterium]|nr:translation initiation factor IF-2 [Bacteroidales bacterium]
MKIENNPNTIISDEIYEILLKEFQSEKAEKEKARQIGIDISSHETVSVDTTSKYKEKFIDKDIEKEEELIIRKTTLEDKGQLLTKPIASKAKETIKKTKKTPAKLTVTKEQTDTTETIDNETKNTEKQKEITKISEEIETKDKPKIKIVGTVDLETITPKPKTDKDKIKSKITETEEEKKQDLSNTTTPTKTEVESEIKEEEEEKKQIETTTSITDENINNELKEIIEKEEADNEKDTDAIGEKPDNFLRTEYKKIEGPKIIGSVDLPTVPIHKKEEIVKKPIASSNETKLKKRKRIEKKIKEPLNSNENQPIKSKDWHQTNEKYKHFKENKKYYKKPEKPVIDDEQIQQQIKETLAKLTAPTKSKAAKYRRAKRSLLSHLQEEQQQKLAEESKTIKVTEFVTVNDLANLMNVLVSNVIQTCLNLGLFVSINQRLDAETIVIVADEFGYKVKFVNVDIEETTESNQPDNPEDLVPRAPIVTVMGHVDHGKTSLLDYIRKSNVIAGEAGGITQHIGAYEVILDNGKKITFLDTPGHEAFTAMRARGAKITDIAIIVIAADDSVMPQTKEAINHALAAGVPMIFAINKIDKPNANPDKIKEELANMKILVEDWGGKYQCQEISAKKGINVDLLLEKVLIEAELMDLKCNPKKPATGTVIESALDKGRGYVAKVLVQNGTLKVGDIVLAGYHYGRVKAMYNERNQKVEQAGPSTPVMLLGLNGAPQAGDTFKVMHDEKETKAIANKRMQLQREQTLRTQKHITLDEIGRRIAIGDFKELNIIVKGDTDGSVEALSDSILKLSSPEVQVNVIHKSVGAITETDVLLASASNAIIIGFQVRPSVNAKKLAEQEQIDIRLYSIIYTAINEVKAAIEGMLSPEIEEKITGNAEVREVFKISKIGTVAGCLVLDGKITKTSNIRLIRDGIVVYTGQLSSLKRFKDDVKEVAAGYECGLSIHNFNDIKIGDIVECYEEVEVKRKL